MKKKLLTLLTLGILAIGVCGCAAKPSTVEEYYTRPAYQAALDEQIADFEESYSSTYSDIGYELSGTTFTYTYTFAQQLEDVDSAKSQLDASLTDSSVADALSSLAEETGVTDTITIEYVYYNADGSEIFRKSFSN